MPIHPRLREHYDTDAFERAKALAQKRAGGRCEGIGQYPDCRAENGQPHPVTSSKVALAPAHVDQDPTNNEPSNVRMLCQRCHNTLDAPYRHAKMLRRRHRKKGLMPLPGLEPDPHPHDELLS